MNLIRCHSFQTHKFVPSKTPPKQTLRLVNAIRKGGDNSKSRVAYNFEDDELEVKGTKPQPKTGITDAYNAATGFKENTNVSSVSSSTSRIRRDPRTSRNIKHLYVNSMTDSTACAKSIVKGLEENSEAVLHASGEKGMYIALRAVAAATALFSSEPTPSDIVVQPLLETLRPKRGTGPGFSSGEKQGSRREAQDPGSSNIQSMASKHSPSLTGPPKAAVADAPVQKLGPRSLLLYLYLAPPQAPPASHCDPTGVTRSSKVTAVTCRVLNNLHEPPNCGNITAAGRDAAVIAVSALSNARRALWARKERSDIAVRIAWAALELTINIESGSSDDSGSNSSGHEMASSSAGNNSSSSDSSGSGESGSNRNGRDAPMSAHAETTLSSHDNKQGEQSLRDADMSASSQGDEVSSLVSEAHEASDAPVFYLMLFSFRKCEWGAPCDPGY